MQTANGWELGGLNNAIIVDHEDTFVDARTILKRLLELEKQLGEQRNTTGASGQ